MSCRRVGIHTLKIEELKALLHHIYSLLLKSTRDLLPEEIAFPEVGFDQIHDDTTTRESFVDSPQVEANFAQLRQDIWESIWRSFFDSDGLFMPEKAEEYLQKDQIFLAYFALAILCLCGKPSRGYNAVDLCYRPVGENERHFHIVNGLLVFGWPRRHRVTGKQSRNAALWVPPRNVGWDLTVYLIVIRPIVIAIVKHLGRPVGQLCTHIFVDSAHSNTATWTGPKFNMAIRSILPSKYRTFDDRSFGELFRSISARHLGPLVEAMNQGVYRTFVNAQGGHSEDTSIIHYGMDSSGHHSAFKMSRRHVETCWAESEVWEAFWGLNTLDERWRVIMHGSKAFQSTETLQYAREVSQRVVLTYLLECADFKSIASRTSQIMRKRPFFLPSVCSSSIQLLMIS